MKKKSVSKSKDREKNKCEDTKSHKHSRRKRKSSSESDGDSSDANEQVRRSVSKKCEKELENNTVSGTRTTRHSRRLAAINAGSDDAKEEIPEALSSPVKTGKSSPFYVGSPSKDLKRKDGGTPEKHKTKDQEVWKVKSANGAGSGELQKLKICRHRSPENVSLSSYSDLNNTEENREEQNTVDENVPQISEIAIENNTKNTDYIVEQNAFHSLSEEDIANIQNIQLPPTDFADETTDSTTARESTELAESIIEIMNDLEKSDDVGNKIVEVSVKEGPPCQSNEVTLNEITSEEAEIVKNVEMNDVQSFETSLSTENIVKIDKSNDDFEPHSNVTEELIQSFDVTDELKSHLDRIKELQLQSDQIVELQTPSDRIEELHPQLDEAKQTTLQAGETKELKLQSDETEVLSLQVDEAEQFKPSSDETGELKPLSVTTEQVQPQFHINEEEGETILVHLELSEPEDNLQTELVLTVEDNAIDEPGTVSVNMESEELSKCAEITESREVESRNPVLRQVDEMEEIYDYENDDTKEEGELSANESMSPIHEVFKKYSADVRKRSWGRCNVFHFSRSNLIADERTLKSLNIKKRAISKEDLEASDPEDLIFVKEIREENIVHEIESETNNTSYFDKDDDDTIPSSSKSKLDSTEIKRKKTLESDKIVDKQNKRHVKESKTQDGEGKTVLYVTNLVRPFTVNQFRELLLRTGRIVEDGFWIDAIKSKCYVQFETEDEALETRHALHGIRWPINNPKVLNVQFATQDDLLSAQAQTHESEIPRKTEPIVVSTHSVEQTQKRIDWKKHFEQYDERPRKIKDVREWDIGKPAHPDDMVFAEIDDIKRKEDPDKLRKSRKDKRRRNETSDDELTTKKLRKSAGDSQSPAEAKLLDDLFRRTKASPSIYWLPLSDEQIATKQETRRKHLEDIDRQMKKKREERDSRRRERERRRSRR